MTGGRDSSGMRYAGLGFELVAVVGAMTLLGWWIDRRFGTAPWGLLIGAVVGLIGGMYNMVRDALQATRPAGDGGRGVPEARQARARKAEAGGESGGGSPGEERPGSRQGGGPQA